MKRATVIVAIAATAMFLPGAAFGEIVDVTITGQVVFNGINEAPLSDVSGGDGVVITFSVDSDNFDDGTPGDTRGYVIDQSTFSMTFDTPLELGLLDPFPAGQTPYFTLVDGFPVSDGFWVSTSPFSPGGVPLEQAPFNANYRTGYEGDTLDSLDILDALGVYGFDGLTVFEFNLWVAFPDNIAMEIDFEQMTVELGDDDPGPVPATSTGGVLVLVLLVLLGTAALLRRSATVQ